MIGRQLGGRYEILERVGGGGMAIVYKGLDILLHRHVAVKVLRQQYVHDEEFIQRFRREAQAAASLSHPNVVSIYDVGQEEDVHYIVMEYIEGTTLNDLIKTRAPLQVEEAVHIAGQICDALDHAHHNQIIHRDIKPHNILIGKNGRVKVTDFGIARAVTSSTITQTGSVVGSVHYFSPEHAKGTPTGEQSDLYSLGIVMYQMLTGRLPFLGESPISVALKHLQEDVEEPRKVNPLIPQSVENVILRAMRKSTTERYRSAKEMLGDLESCLLPHRRNEPKVNFLDDDELDEERTRVMPALRPDQFTIDRSSLQAAEDDEDDEEEPAAPRKKKRWVKPLVIILVLLAVLGGMWYAVGVVKAKVMIERVDVPTVVGLQLVQAQQMLHDAKLESEFEYVKDDKNSPKDTVVRQSHSDMKVNVGSKITLYVSQGPDKKKMPDLVKLKLGDATTRLKELGIAEKNIVVESKFMDEPPDTVVSQTPAADEEFADPAAVMVKLVVSKGRESIPMPNLIGKTENEAKNMLLVNNLKLAKDGITYEASYKQSKGKVIGQFPYQPNDSVPPGTEITLTVSSGLPEEAGPMSVSIPIKPAQEGKASTVKILLTDATYDTPTEYQTLSNVTKTEMLQVKLVVSPDKNAVIQVKVDNNIADLITVTYQDYLMQKSGKPVTPSTGTPNTGAGGTGIQQQGGTNKPAGTDSQAPANNGGAKPAQGGTSVPAGGASGNTTTGGRMS
ncbi:Stk1 family PASTA domain-containing Ser/Thr kinase [Paenibacillus validus]|uniref:Serine/threonine-protein kinase PrkC n=1 Tax=Paenibacillus validus TaxID=44253 RepID=A0A7X2ZGE2_9BACL|nr:Stk1 family PASTA domain-containing Ser/Thr kinase [Paenibacillus validus]MED4602574.1 Stk1 family PASTA domain-containing Ser/Thr kinase [Paenibacillus validus]MED4609643.1 Stk1 family PASTA domain-containing Ser/Thr kinase [Paenibacillus validus]MUG73696.1 Stk1 family PASTA domain-containing Ser/Thr kinase [Paenibacillus validus]